MKDKFNKIASIFIWSFILPCISFTLIGLVSAETIPYKIGNNTLQFTCTVGTSKQIPSNSATYNYSIYFQNGTTLLENKQATPLGQGSFYADVYLPSIETYTTKEFCYDTLGNSSNQESIPVTSTGNSFSLKLLIFLFIGGIVFLCLSLFGNEEFFIFISGLFFLLGGLFMWIYGFGDLNNWYTFGIGIIGVGLGILLIFQAYSGEENLQEDYTDTD
jgi:hypothetical protein